MLAAHDDFVVDLLGRLLDKLEGWLTALVDMLPSLAVAALTVVAASFAARWIGRSVHRVLSRGVHSAQIAGLLGKLAYVAVVAGGIFAALGILQLEKTVTSLLAGVGIVGLALGFAFQDIAANFVSGVLMAIRRPFAVGDLVKVSDYFGRVEKVDLRATRLTRLSGETVIIPNKDVFQSAIENITDTKCRRVDIEVGVSYGDDLDEARRIALESVEALPDRDPARDVELFYTGFGASSIDFTLRFWIVDADQLPYLSARSEAIMAIKRGFDEAGITIPFPIRTLDFGIVGGAPLTEMLRPVSDDPPRRVSA